jgi:hypothetical protein
MMILRYFVPFGERRDVRDAPTGEHSYLAPTEVIKLIPLGKRGNLERWLHI